MLVRVVLLLVLITSLGCQQKAWHEDLVFTNEMIKERSALLAPLQKQTELIVKGDRARLMLPTMEGRPTSDYQRLLDLADRVTHLPSEKVDRYIIWATPESGFNYGEVGPTDRWPGFIVTVKDGKILEAWFPPQPEF